MKKVYIAPEAEVVTLAVENVTNALDINPGNDDQLASMGNGGSLGGLFGQ